MKSEIYAQINEVSGQIKYLYELRDRMSAGGFIPGDLELELIDRNLAELLNFAKQGNLETWLVGIDKQLKAEEEKLNNLTNQLITIE